MRASQQTVQRLLHPLAQDSVLPIFQPKPARASQGIDPVTDQEIPAVLPNGLPLPHIPRRLRELLKTIRAILHGYRRC
jgi:hypothetical protein